MVWTAFLEERHSSVLLPKLELSPCAFLDRLVGTQAPFHSSDVIVIASNVFIAA